MNALGGTEKCPVCGSDPYVTQVEPWPRGHGPAPWAAGCYRTIPVEHFVGVNGDDRADAIHLWNIETAKVTAMDVNSPEAALWSENMRLKSVNEYFRTILTGIAVMDVYTRPGEEPAANLMRAAAKEAIEKHP